MKAIRQYEFGDPDVLQLEEIPDPEPGTGEIVVELRAIGVNPVETYIRSGIYPKPPTPFTLGGDGAGVIVRIGAEVTNWQVGDRVYIAGSLSGTYAEQTLCKTSQIFPLAEGASFQQGAAVNVPYVTAYQAMVHRGRAQPGETLFVHGGSGGVGTAAIQFGRMLGMQVIASAGTKHGLELVQAQGAHLAINHTEPNYLDAVHSFTQGRGADLILEMLANQNLNEDLTVIARSGRIVLIGNRGEKNQGKVAINSRAAMAKDADILGMVMYNATPRETKACHAAIVAGLANSTLQPVVGQEFALIDAAAAHRAVIDNRAYGKIVLIP